jgi:hypothetical protein
VNPWLPLFRLLCLLPLLFSKVFAQQLPAWPRQAPSGRISFTGLIPWPTPRLTLAQQQALVRRWYYAKLTQLPPRQRAQWAKEGVTFAGVPTLAYVDSVFYSPDSSGALDSVYGRGVWRLMYRVHLAPTAKGLQYRLSEFECAEMAYDASTGDTLENVLLRYAVQQAVFYRSLRKALAGW